MKETKNEFSRFNTSCIQFNDAAGSHYLPSSMPMKMLLHQTLAFAVAGSLCAAEPAASSGLRLDLLSPLDYQVVQRATRTEGNLIIAGAILSNSKETPPADALEVLVSGKSNFGNLSAQWQPLPFDARVAAFRAEIPLPAGGWYRVSVRALRDGAPVASTGIEHVGVGEIFVVAGQSNCGNYGEERQTTVTGLVAAFDGAAWRPANDPQPGAGGNKGSFIPSFGDAMAARFHVPIGIVAMGIGSTSVREWLPPRAPISRLPTITRNVAAVGTNQWEALGKIFDRFTTRLKGLGPFGFRAVLWHQGESDANQADPQRTLPGDDYRRDLERLIGDSRRAIGWQAPWFVAQASYHSPQDPASPEIRAAQKAVWDAGVALPGPDTDALTGDMREKNGAGVHLSAKGLAEHGRLWAAKVGPWLERQLDAAQHCIRWSSSWLHQVGKLNPDGRGGKNGKSENKEDMYGHLWDTTVADQEPVGNPTAPIWSRDFRQNFKARRLDEI